MNTDIHEIRELRHQLHRCAELSMQEHRTKEELIRFLKTHTSMEIMDQGSWFYGITGKEKPGVPVAFRADMDALPMEETISLPYASEHEGVSHKCGHDGHMACLCALAQELEQNPVDRPVCFVFQPGEEIGAGGKACAEHLFLLGVREVYAFHNRPGFPAGSVVIRRGLTQPASEGCRLHFRGKCSHASEPEKGANPAMVMARTLLHLDSLLKELWQGMVLGTVVGVSAGAGDFGISAGDGELSITLRAEWEDEMKELERRVIRFAREQAEKEGITVTTEIVDYFPETRNDDAALDRVVKAAQKLGKPVIRMEQIWRASEDFGYYTKKIPGAMFYIGAGEETAPLHTPEYDFNDRIIETAVDVMQALAGGCQV